MEEHTLQRAADRWWGRARSAVPTSCDAADRAGVMVIITTIIAIKLETQSYDDGWDEILLKDLEVHVRLGVP